MKVGPVTGGCKQQTGEAYQVMPEVIIANAEWKDGAPSFSEARYCVGCCFHFFGLSFLYVWPSSLKEAMIAGQWNNKLLTTHNSRLWRLRKRRKLTLLLIL